MPIDGRKSHGNIVKELIEEYKESGKIGNTEPDDMKHALEIANAIAYKEKGTSKFEALKGHIQSLVRPENKAFLEGVVLNGLDACFESATDTLDDIPVRLMGRTFFWDNAEDEYYEPATDRYLEHSEYVGLKAADDAAQKQYAERIDKAIQQSSDHKELNKLMNSKNLYWDQDAAREAEAMAMKITGDMPAVMEADDLESDDVVRMDTDSMTSDEIDVVQTQLDEIKEDKADIEEQEAEISQKEEDLVNTSAALSLNEDDDVTA